MTHLPLCIRMLFLIALCCSAARAQQTNSTQKSEADEALRQKAFELLESLAGQLSILQSPENRARLASNIADSLWDHDESRARTLLLSVQADLNAGMQSEPSGDEAADELRRMIFLQLRVNTVERIAKHDAELALAFFKATEPPELTQKGREYAHQIERALELQLANQVAANSTQVALKLAQRSLEHGLRDDQIPVLLRLTRKHKDEGLALYQDIVAQLKDSDLIRDGSNFYFAEHLARSLAPPVIEESAFRGLITVFTNAAAKLGCANKITDDEDGQRSYYCREIATLTPLIERVDHARAAGLKQWFSEDYRDYGNYYELNDVAQEGTVEEILALTSKYPQMEADIYLRAAHKAMESGDIERARKIANDFPGEPQRRQEMLEMIDRSQKDLAEFRDMLRNVQAMLDSLPNTREKFLYLLFASGQIANTDRKEAQKLRDRAAGMIETMRPGKDPLEAQMILAATYCFDNDSRGLSMMESLVPKLNELISAAAKLDGYENHHLRDGEWNMSSEGELGLLLTQLADGAPGFAWCDFDRAVSIAGQFERPEIRLMAQLKLAQGILAGRPKPFVANSPYLFR